MGLFGRMGCNAGSCHGSFQGKGGFRLSLFGYDPDKDYAALTRDGHGRRIDPADPDSSLLLLKATGQVAHGGGTRFGKDSWQYQLLRELDRRRARRGTPGSGDVKSRHASRPPSTPSRRPARPASSRSTATFADGTERGHHRRCATSAPTTTPSPRSPTSGEVTALRPGDTAIVVSYRGNVLPVRVLVPIEAAAGLRLPEGARGQLHRPRGVRQAASGSTWCRRDLSSDAEFLRRVTIDTIGTLPTPDEVRDVPGRQATRTSARRRSTSCWPTRCTRPCGRPSSATSPATTPTRWRTRSSCKAKLQPDVARLVPQARRRRTCPTTRSSRAC